MASERKVVACQSSLRLKRLPRQVSGVNKVVRWQVRGMVKEVVNKMGRWLGRVYGRCTPHAPTHPMVMSRLPSLISFVLVCYPAPEAGAVSSSRFSSSADGFLVPMMRG